MQHLQPNSTLQGGKYKIMKALGLRRGGSASSDNNNCSHWIWGSIVVIAIVVVCVFWLNNNHCTVQNDISVKTTDYSQNQLPAQHAEELVVMQNTSSKPINADDVTYMEYSNRRFGFSVSYPDFLKPQPVSDNQDGRVFKKDSQTYMTAYGCYNVNEETISELYHNARKLSDTYHACGNDWFVVSGNNSDGTIYYKRSAMSGDVIYTLCFNYKPSESDLFSRLIPIVISGWKHS